MKVQNKEILQSFKEYSDSIKEDSVVYVMHDTDMDGMTAATLMKKGLEKFGKNKFIFEPFNHSSNRKITEEFVSGLNEFKITHFVALDLALESFEGVDLLDELNILVIDHHQIESEEWKTKNNFLVIKPYFTVQEKVDGSNICTANLVYNTFNEFTEMSKHDWICAAGIIGDAGYKDEKEFVDDVLKKYGEEIKEDVFKTQLGRLVSYGTYGDCMGAKDSLAIIFKALDESKNYGEAIQKMISFKPVEDEMNKAIENYETQKEVHRDIYFYEVKSKYDIKGPVSTYLSFNKPYDQTMITYQIHNNSVSISARRQDKKYNMGKLMKHICEQLENARGGGHIPAAGAGIQAKDLETFKKLVIELQETTRTN